MLDDESSKNVNIYRETNTDTDRDTSHDDHQEQHNQTGFFSRCVQSRFLTPLLYVILGLLVFFSFLIIFNTHIIHLKVEAAVVSSEIEAMVSPVGGYITDVYVTLGERVKKNRPLLKIENIELVRELALARIQVEESKLDIHYYQQLLDNEQKKLALYKRVGLSRVDSSEAFVNIYKQNVFVTHNNLDRYQALYQKHYISAENLEQEHNKYVNAQESLKNAQSENFLQKNALEAIDQGIYFTGNKVEGAEHDLEAALEAAQKRELLNRNRVKIYEDLNSRLILKAPFDGKITQILKSAGNTADNVKPLIFIENTASHKNIVAYLTQNEVVHIGNAKGVKIYIPSSGKTYRGNILEINRTEGFIDMVKAQYQWRDFQIDRSAMVTIKIQDMDKKIFDAEAFAGMPVIVYFSKRSGLT